MGKSYYKVYIGSNFFTEGNAWQANEIERKIKERFGDFFEVYNPLNNMDINDKANGFSSGIDILKADYGKLRESHALIALMDGQDLGLAAEMGIAFERGIHIYQLHTDSRLTGNDNADKLNALKEDVFQNDFMYVNKLVTALSYCANMGNGRVEEYKRPLIYKNQDDLLDNLGRNFAFHLMRGVVREGNV